MKFIYRFISLGVYGVPEGFLLYRTTSGDESVIELEFTDAKANYLFIGEKKYKLTDGRIMIPTSALPEGSSKLTVTVGSVRYPADPLYRSQSGIYSPLSDSISQALLITALPKMREELEEQKKRISALEDKILPASVLKF